MSVLFWPRGVRSLPGTSEEESETTMTVLRRTIHIAAIVLNAFWAARVVQIVWGRINWARVLHNNPFDYGGWIVWGSLFAPALAVVALLWTFPQRRDSQAG
jgi:hypothetical protein